MKINEDTSSAIHVGLGALKIIIAQDKSREEIHDKNNPF